MREIIEFVITLRSADDWQPMQDSNFLLKKQENYLLTMDTFLTSFL